ncbi:MAG TPA: hypothetical protein VN793_05625, partial [Acidimicrobiales bacterium]|nr:hypothetical protein [Acidimicrobiales bacterium]
MKLRPFHFRLRSLAAAGFATLLALAGGVFLATTPASAVVADGITALTGFSVGTLNPPFATGTINQAASNISFTIPSAASAATNGDVIKIQAQPHASANCSKSATDFVGFSNFAGITVVPVGTGTLTLTPTLSTAASDPASCAGVNDVLTLTASGASGTGPFTVTISLIDYNVGVTADPGTIAVGISSTTTTPVTTTFYAINTGITSPPSDASVINNGATATANNPAVVV